MSTSASSAPLKLLSGQRGPTSFPTPSSNRSLSTPEEISVRLQNTPGDNGLYGPQGWTVAAGVWPILTHGKLTESPTRDYIPFTHLGPTQASALLSLLPAEQLEDRQNLAPTLGCLLRACVQAEGSVELYGYGIGPQRSDERISAEAMWIADDDLREWEIFEDHVPGCHCHEIWHTVRDRYHLDAQCIPDEIRVMERHQGNGQWGTWLWWD